MKYIGAILFLLLFAVQVDASTYWVSKSGNDGNGCFASSTQPNLATQSKLTINGGLKCLSGGDTLMILNGIYGEQINGGIPSGSNLGSGATVIRAVNRRQVILNPSNSGIIGPGSNAAYIIFQGLVADGANCSNAASCDSLVGVAGNSHHIRFDDVEVKNGKCNLVQFSPPAGGGGGATFSEFINGSLHDNAINQCSTGGIASGSGYGVYNSGQNNLISHNVMFNLSAYGIHGYSDYGGVNNNTYSFNVIHDVGRDLSHNFWSGILAASGSNNQVIGNVIYNNANAAGAGSCCGATNTKFYNNTIYNNTTPYSALGWTSNTETLQNNIVYQNSTDMGGSGTPTFGGNWCTSAGTGCAYNGVPGFVSAGTGDFHLSAGSKTIDTGVNLSSALSCPSVNCFDIAGVARPQGTGWDIGAYEFAQAVTITVSITGSNRGCVSFVSCTVTQNSIILSGSTDAHSAGAVTFSTDRGSNGTATWTPTAGTSNWTTAAITLKSGTNHITISSTDASNNLGMASITVIYAPPHPGNALVAAYAFEGDATDSAGTNNGSLVGGASITANGRYGQGLSLNAALSQYVSIPNATAFDFTQSFTLSAWVQIASSRTDYRAVIHKVSSSGDSIPPSPYELYGSIGGSCGSGGIEGLTNIDGVLHSRFSACSVASLSPGNWTHLAVTYDNATLKLYKNGTLLTTTTVSGYLEASTYALLIGATEFGEYWDGLIDEVRIYNFALPATSTNNTTYSAPCNAEEYQVASASVMGDVNCPVIPFVPPPTFWVGASSTFAIGAGTTFAIGAAQ